MNQYPPPDHTLIPSTFSPLEIEQGKGLALIAYLSMFTGLPLFLVPMLDRKNAYALHHSRFAGVIYIESIIVGFAFAMMTFITCGFGALLFPILFIFWLPTIQGLIYVVNGDARAPIGTESLAQSLFYGVKPLPPG